MSKNRVMNHHKPDEGLKQKTIFYDGLCMMCKSLAHKIDESGQQKSFVTKDITQAKLPKGLSKADLEKEIHVIDTDGRVYKNASAILKILEEYPRLRFLSWVGALPGCRQLFQLGYKLVAANRHFLFGPSSRIFYAKTVLIIGFMASFLLSFKLWMSDRLYPLTPLLHGFRIPLSLNWLCIALLLTLLLGSLFIPRPRYSILAAAGTIGVFIVADQARLQPWVYQYVLMLLAIGLFSWRRRDAQGMNVALHICRLIIIGTYIYSGLQKFNAEFINVMFPWMLTPITDHLPSNIRLYAVALGVLIPIMELGIGIGLATKKFRNLAVCLAIAMHLSILFLLGPLGKDWNSVVWPWNITMIALDCILFWKSDAAFRDIIWLKRDVYQKLIVLLFIVMPLFSFFNLWDSYLSSTLYSHNTNQASLYLSRSSENYLPSAIKKYAVKDTQDTYNAINISTLSFGLLNVPAYPEPRIFKRVAASMCGLLPDKGPRSMLLQIHERSTILREGQVRTYTCADL